MRFDAEIGWGSAQLYDGGCCELKVQTQLGNDVIWMQFFHRGSNSICIHELLIFNSFYDPGL